MGDDTHFPKPDETIDETTDDGFPIRLSKYAAQEPRRAVILFHGASASSRTFLVPQLEACNGLVDYLVGQRCDVWCVDWRGSMLLSDQPALRTRTLDFTMDHVARYDIPKALEIVASTSGRRPLSVVAHCVGAATYAMAVGGGHLAQAPSVERVLLSTIGLFYSVPWDGWIKAEDQILERALIDEPNRTSVHCNVDKHPWPENIERAYRAWPTTLLPSKVATTRDRDEVVFDADHPLRRLAFMFGRPFLEGNVVGQLLSRDALLAQFGGMPMTMYIHAGQQVRRGFAAPYDDYSWSPAKRGPTSPRGRLDPNGAGRYLHPERFTCSEFTLLTGELNQLWHRDSINRMYEWLQRENGVRVKKHVVRDYAHQDLYWGPKARRDVYPLISSAVV